MGKQIGVGQIKTMPQSYPKFNYDLLRYSVCVRVWVCVGVRKWLIDFQRSDNDSKISEQATVKCDPSKSVSAN